MQGYAAAYGLLVPTAAENILNCNFLHILLGDEALKPQPEGKGKGFLIAFTLARQNHFSGEWCNCYSRLIPHQFSTTLH